MGSRSVLTKNYFIYPETVAEYGAEIERVMTETDRAMEEASEIIAKMAFVTEKIPSQIRSGELLEQCEMAQAEIRSFDFLSYGKRVNQGLLNLLDQNQYITENFINKMGATTERVREFGAGCRRLTELIDYSGESLTLKGLAFAAVSSPKSTDVGVGEGGITGQGKEQETGQENILDYFMSYDEEKRIGIGLLDAQICSKLGITDINDRKDIIQALLNYKPGIFETIYYLNRTSDAYYQNVMDETLSKAEEYFQIISQNQIGGEDRDTMKLCAPEVEAYLGYPEQEGFEHIIQLNGDSNGDSNGTPFNPYSIYYIEDIKNLQEIQQTNQQTICLGVDITDRNKIEPRAWYSYMNRTLDDLQDYYSDPTICGYECTRYENYENQLTVNTGEKEYNFWLINDKWWVDENGRYLITVGPKVLDMDFVYEDETSLYFSNFERWFGCRIDVILVKDNDPNTVVTLECIYGGDIKEHVCDNGIYMNGREYPDGKQTDEPDGSIVEFFGMTDIKSVDSNGKITYDNGFMPGYHVEMLIVYDNDNAGEVN